MCGGTRHVSKRGSVVVSSPGYPATYRWSPPPPTPQEQSGLRVEDHGTHRTLPLIHLPAGEANSGKVTMVQVDLPDYRNCSAGDYVQVGQASLTANPPDTRVQCD